MHIIEWGGLQTFQLIIVVAMAVFSCIGLYGYNQNKK